VNAIEPASYATRHYLNETYAEITKLSLEANVAELDAYGFTIVEPDRVAPPEFQARALEAVLALHQRRTGQPIAPDEVGSSALPGTYALYHAALFEDSVFQDMVVHPIVLTLARYLTGRSCELSDFAPYLRSQGSSATPLHSDSAGVPPPMPAYAQVCNVTWIHSDYSKDNGALSIVPGSHRFCRAPLASETDGYRDDSPFPAIAIEAPAGSLICWHGNTWHGAWKRRNPGIRVATIMYFCRTYYRKLVDHGPLVTGEALARHPAELAEILGLSDPTDQPGRVELVRRDTSGSQWA
jgi:hypothetical protein